MSTGPATLRLSDRRPGAHLILGRGGVRGIAMIGAVDALHRAGYRFDRCAGISVGAIIAGLIAAGYEPTELRRLVGGFVCSSLRDATGFGRVPLVGPAWRLLRRFGLYDGDVLLERLRILMERRAVRVFADLRDPAWNGVGSPYRLQVLCADVTRRRLVVLPDDAPDYGLEPDRLEVALALRMSASLPAVFRPMRLGTGPHASLVVDGGVLAGIPFHLFDCGRHDDHVFAVQAGPGPRRGPGDGIAGPISFLQAAYYTILQVNDGRHRGPAGAARVIDIDCGDIGAADFSLSADDKESLYDIGLAAGLRFLGGAFRPLPAAALTAHLAGRHEPAM